MRVRPLSGWSLWKKPSLRLIAALALAGASAGGLDGCIHHARQSSTYPARPPHCALRIFHGPVPRGIYYDDIGPVDAGCYLETTRTECLRQLHTQACKMGGDIVYDLPESPSRPEWREYHYKGTVAHSRPIKKEDVDEGRAPAETKLDEGAGSPTNAASPAASDDAGATATADEANAPVVPLSAVPAATAASAHEAPPAAGGPDAGASKP